LRARLANGGAVCSRLTRGVSLHMRVQHSLSILVLSVLISGAAQACAGGDAPEQEQISQWVVDRTAAATHVFLGRITRVKRSGRIPALDTTAEFELLELLKGAPRFSVLSISECQNFELKENDIRVFFVSGEGMILPFTDYRRFMSNDELLALLRLEHKGNAN
jgi:hypothetical protein